ncbi:MAG: hypothetical protein HG425_013655 [Propionibacterium sp.]|jgi:hypothetical protein|nr:hypothetical protein [Propionibacterium sp.]
MSYLVVEKIGKRVGAVTVACCLGLAGCGDGGVGAAREDALQRLEKLVWLEDPASVRSGVEAATTRDGIADLISGAEAENTEREATYWRCAARASRYVQGGSWGGQSDSVDGREVVHVRLDLNGDGTAGFVVSKRDSRVGGSPSVAPSAGWVAGHEGAVTAWSSDLGQVVTEKQLRADPAKKLYKGIGYCNVGFKLSLTTGSGVEDIDAFLELNDSKKPTRLDLGDGLLLGEREG